MDFYHLPFSLAVLTAEALIFYPELTGNLCVCVYVYV